MSYITGSHGDNLFPRIALHVVSSYEWQDADEKRDAEDMLRRVGSLNGDNILVRVIVREGSLTRPFMIICLIPAVLP